MLIFRSKLHSFTTKHGGLVSKAFSIIGRSCSTSTSNEIVPNRIIPSNLILSDPNAIEAEPEPKFKRQDYLYPLLNPTPSLPVQSFAHPGVKLEIEVPLDKFIFGVAIRKDIIHEVIRYHRAKRRQPKKTKRIDEISGSTKKPRPQKGGGQGQAGHKRNSAWRGGQKAHGPVLRDYSFNLNRKYRAMGMMIALAAKQREGNLIVFDELKRESHRTKPTRELLIAHGLDEPHLCLFVDAALDPNFALSVRNLPAVEARVVEHINVYEIVKRDKLVVTAAALEKIQERLLEQYNHIGRRKAYLRGLETVAEAQSIDRSEIKDIYYQD